MQKLQSQNSKILKNLNLNSVAVTKSTDSFQQRWSILSNLSINVQSIKNNIVEAAMPIQKISKNPSTEESLAVWVRGNVSNVYYVVNVLRKYFIRNMGNVSYMCNIQNVYRQKQKSN